MQFISCTKRQSRIVSEHISALRADIKVAAASARALLPRVYSAPWAIAGARWGSRAISRVSEPARSPDHPN